MGLEPKGFHAASDIDDVNNVDDVNNYDKHNHNNDFAKPDDDVVNDIINNDFVAR
jgi:hypothetical protein